MRLDKVRKCKDGCYIFQFLKSQMIRTHSALALHIPKLWLKDIHSLRKDLFIEKPYTREYRKYKQILFGFCKIFGIKTY